MNQQDEPSNVNELMMIIKYPEKLEKIQDLLIKCFKENFGFKITDDEIKIIKNAFGVSDNIIITNIKDKNILLFGMPENSTTKGYKYWVNVNIFRSKDDPQWKIVPNG